MTVFVLAALKMSAVLALSLLAASMLRRRSAALRHWVLASGMLLASLTPLAGRLLPAWPMLPAWDAPAGTAQTLSGQPLRFSAAGSESAATASVAPPAPAALPVADILLAVWAAGAVLGIGSMVIGAWRLRSLARRAAPVRRGAWRMLHRRIALDHGVSRPVTLLQSAHPSLLVTWGLWRPKVFLPAPARDWSSARISVVLHHELAHIVRADWLVLMAAALMRAICWFNPLVWIAYWRLRDESEHACDDIVLRHVDGGDYASHLVDIARSVCHARRGWLPAPAVAHPTTLERRIRAMLNPDCDRTPLTGRARLAAALVLSAAALTVAAAALAAPVAPMESRGTADIELEAMDAPRPAPTAVVPFKPAPAVAQAPAAQSGRGVLSGVVLDQLGGLVPGAEITLTSEATGGALVRIADGGGRFEFTDVRPGQYALQAALPGFQIVKALVTVAAGAVHARTLTLSIGSLEETITVTGERGASPAATPPAARTPRAPSRPTNDIEEMRRALDSLAKRAAAADAFRAGSIGGQVKAPVKLAHTNPLYPASMQAAGVEGVVRLVARVGVDGYVISAVEAREADFSSAVNPELVASAIDAVRLWKFSPTLLNGVPVEVDIKVSVQYSLR